MAHKVREVMARDLVTVSDADSVTDAAKAMRAGDVGDVLVLTGEGELCGLVTDRDIAVRAVAEGRDSTSTSVQEICSRDVTSVSPDDDLASAARTMRERAVRRLPVVEGGKPVGVVSIGDLAIEEDPGSALADISAARGNR